MWAGARNGLYLSLDDLPADLDAAYRNAVQLEFRHRTDAEVAPDEAVRLHRVSNTPGRVGRWGARLSTVAYARAVEAFAEAAHLAQQGGILVESWDDYRRTVGRH